MSTSPLPLDVAAVRLRNDDPEDVLYWRSQLDALSTLRDYTTGEVKEILAQARKGKTSLVSSSSKARSARTRASEPYIQQSAGLTSVTPATRTASSPAPPTQTDPSSLDQEDSVAFPESRPSRQTGNPESIRPTLLGLDVDLDRTVQNVKRPHATYAAALKPTQYKRKRPESNSPLVYQCPVCQEDFTHDSSFKDHFKNKHSRETEIKCSHCEGLFYTPRIFNEHHTKGKCSQKCKEAPAHTDIFPPCAQPREPSQKGAYGCSICGDPFPTLTKYLCHFTKAHRAWRGKDEPSVSKEILGLLHQPKVANEWKRVSKPNCDYSWDPETSKQLRSQLETGKIGSKSLQTHGDEVAKALATNALNSATLQPQSNASPTQLTKQTLADMASGLGLLASPIDRMGQPYHPVYGGPRESSVFQALDVVPLSGATGSNRGATTEVNRGAGSVFDQFFNIEDAIS